MHTLKELYKIGFGPSSSHTMGPAYATSIFLKHYPNFASYKVILYASLACTGKGHLTDTIILRVAKDKKMEIVFDYTTKVEHPNTMEFFAYDENKTQQGYLKVISVGGGSIKIIGKRSKRYKNIYPFKSFSEIKEYALKTNLDLIQIIYTYDHNIKKYLLKVWKIMKKAIQNGLTKEGELPGELKVKRKAKTLFNTSIENESNESYLRRIVSAYAFAVSEENASGGIIVTAPTCGASGCLPAVLMFYQQKYNYSDEQIADALAIAGLFGNLIKTNASISGAEAGCQVEVGSASAMAAAAIAYLHGLPIAQIEYAAEVSLEHQLGMTCDPIKGYVQIPCIERNAVAALRAIDAAYLARFLEASHLISFDLVVQTMYETGKDINEQYRETSTGGLAKLYKVS